MKILFTGGGTGGHFYPVIAVASQIRAMAKENKLIDVELFYMSTTPYDAGLLFEHDITFIKTSAGKIRRAKSVVNTIRNFFDLFKTGWGVLTSIWRVYLIYPDVIFGKGGYASFPALLAGRILRIPVIIHESDSVPGKVNIWAGRFAVRIALSYAECAKFFPEGDKQNKIAVTGSPVREELAEPLSVGAFEFLQLDPHVPTVLFLGGSQGAVKLNETLIDVLPQLLERYQIIHQTGARNFTAVREVANAVLFNDPHKDRYKAFDYLNLLALRMSARAASVVVSRAGSTIFEIAAWAKPSIIIPIPEATSHDQTKNAFAYARTGACSVIEEKNLTPHILAAEITRLIENKDIAEKMSSSARLFFHPDAAKKIATEVLNIALSHPQ